MTEEIGRSMAEEAAALASRLESANAPLNRDGIKSPFLAAEEWKNRFAIPEEVAQAIDGIDVRFEDDILAATNGVLDEHRQAVLLDQLGAYRHDNGLAILLDPIELRDEFNLPPEVAFSMSRVDLADNSEVKRVLNNGMKGKKSAKVPAVLEKMDTYVSDLVEEEYQQAALPEPEPIPVVNPAQRQRAVELHERALKDAEERYDVYIRTEDFASRQFGEAQDEVDRISKQTPNDYMDVAKADLEREKREAREALTRSAAAPASATSRVVIPAAPPATATPETGAVPGATPETAGPDVPRDAIGRPIASAAGSRPAPASTGRRDRSSAESESEKYKVKMPMPEFMRKISENVMKTKKKAYDSLSPKDQAFIDRLSKAGRVLRPRDERELFMMATRISADVLPEWVSLALATGTATQMFIREINTLVEIHRELKDKGETMFKVPVEWLKRTGAGQILFKDEKSILSKADIYKAGGWGLFMGLCAAAAGEGVRVGMDIPVVKRAAGMAVGKWMAQVVTPNMINIVVAHMEAKRSGFDENQKREFVEKSLAVTGATNLLFTALFTGEALLEDPELRTTLSSEGPKDSGELRDRISENATGIFQELKQKLNDSLGDDGKQTLEDIKESAEQRLGEYFYSTPGADANAPKENESGGGINLKDFFYSTPDSADNSADKSGASNPKLEVDVNSSSKPIDTDTKGGGSKSEPSPIANEQLESEMNQSPRSSETDWTQELRRETILPESNEQFIQFDLDKDGKIDAYVKKDEYGNMEEVVNSKGIRLSFAGNDEGMILDRILRENPEWSPDKASIAAHDLASKGVEPWDFKAIDAVKEPEMPIIAPPKLEKVEVNGGYYMKDPVTGVIWEAFSNSDGKLPLNPEGKEGGELHNLFKLANEYKGQLSIEELTTFASDEAREFQLKYDEAVDNNTLPVPEGHLLTKDFDIDGDRRVDSAWFEDRNTHQVNLAVLSGGSKWELGNETITQAIGYDVANETPYFPPDTVHDVATSLTQEKMFENLKEAKDFIESSEGWQEVHQDLVKYEVNDWIQDYFNLSAADAKNLMGYLDFNIDPSHLENVRDLSEYMYTSVTVSFLDQTWSWGSVPDSEWQRLFEKAGIKK